MCEPYNGMVVSFHHHLRGGDYLLIQTIEILDKLGIKDITLASSSLTTAHDGLVPYLKKGTITRIFSSGIRGKLGEAISYGIMEKPVVNSFSWRKSEGYTDWENRDRPCYNRRLSS